MYHIGICDDEPLMQTFLKDMTESILNEWGIPFSCSVFGNLDELYQAILSKEAPIHVILLDILMGEEKNGIDFAARLRREQRDVSIVFISSSMDYVLKGYDVQAVKYIVKPVEREELKKALWYDYYHHYRQSYLSVPQDRHWLVVKLRDVVFMEIDGKKIAIHMMDQTVISCRKRIHDIEKDLPADSFCLCHRSFLINLENVTEIVRYEARMADKSIVPISKNYFKKTQEAFLHYMAGRFL